MKTDTTYPFQAKLTIEGLTHAIMTKVVRDANDAGRETPSLDRLCLAGRVHFLDANNQAVPIARVLITMDGD